MVMIFFLSIFINLKDGLWFAIIEKGFFDKKLSTDPESDINDSSTALSN